MSSSLDSIIRFFEWLSTWSPSCYFHHGNLFFRPTRKTIFQDKSRLNRDNTVSFWMLRQTDFIRLTFYFLSSHLFLETKDRVFYARKATEFHQCLEMRKNMLRKIFVFHVSGLLDVTQELSHGHGSHSWNGYTNIIPFEKRFVLKWDWKRKFSLSNWLIQGLLKGNDSHKKRIYQSE